MDTDNGGKLENLMKEQLGFKNKKNCLFLCLAVGSSFPTFLSMELRRIYHTSDSNIPPVFLINNVQDDDQYSTQFSQIRKHLKNIQVFNNNSC